MPALDIENPGVSAVSAFGELLNELLNEASAAKETTTIEPALSKSDFANIYDRVSSSLARANIAGAESNAPQDSLRSRQFAVVETAARDSFSKLIATTSIDSPKFVRMWNLLDILSILSDDGQCDPALLFWLVEELLDSQTIAGCRIIFDFLESRRERITAKHFKQKNLVILRSCNELLRRLSRAEDTAFCGRVFIFMFQSFPLGDRSSVNLRGEYHVENVTSFETPEDDDSKMEVDAQAEAPKESGAPKTGAKNGAQESNKALDSDTLYPLFWSLQESFSQPLKLFDVANFTKFKSSLESTIKAFQAIHDDSLYTSKSMENLKRTLKRKRDDDGTETLPEAFNPKYLTSKDLFQLEISDLSFRRHVLVQALIITDFLLSLSKEEREKRTNINVSNKSVIYPDQLNEENTKWATDIKKVISDYLKQGADGPYFFRMVETVLARDKNWVFWKMASCPPIQRDPVSAQGFLEAREAAQRMATSKRLRPNPLNAVPLDFLANEDETSALDKLKDSERYQLPELDAFKSKIADDDFEIEMPTNSETKAAAVAGKASKSWRALRIASRFRLAAFDKLDDPKKINLIFEDDIEGAEDEEDAEPTASEDDMPKNRDPIILSASSGIDISSLKAKLMDLHKGVFAPVVRHAVREPKDGEANGKTYHFVKAQEFNQLRDGDRLVEYTTRDGVDYGTSSKAVEAVVDAGKVPIIELDVEAAQFAKDMDFSARYIFIKSSSDETFDESRTNELFDTVVEDKDNLEETATSVGEFIYAEKQEDEGETTANGDASMEDAPPADGDEEEEEEA
ncbi:THO complex subunit 1 transcription elongation factor-domain-containing protein [Trichoderma asperelloides]|nr:THO complex subunit 1 transcription elongation factor-domain-containing protein [Trichoderma asperelloides]